MANDKLLERVLSTAWAQINEEHTIASQQCAERIEHQQQKRKEGNAKISATQMREEALRSFCLFYLILCGAGFWVL